MDDDKSSHDQIKEIADRLNYLETVARDTASRLYAVETRLGVSYSRSASGTAARPPRQQAPPAEPPAGSTPQPPGEQQTPEPQPRSITSQPPRSEVPVVPISPDARPPASEQQQRWFPTNVDAPVSRRSILGIGAPQGPPPAVAQPSSTVRRGGPDLEARIGGNWFNRIGIIAICFGVAFFLKYAFDNEWIGPGGRVLIGVAIGIGFLVGGERLRKRYASYAYGLTGGGLAILYLAIWFASQNRYNLIPQMLAFVLMAMVTAAGSLLAARYDALPIAVLALIGGFLTPILLSTGVDNETGLFGYIALLDAGVLALAYSKQWRNLNYLAFVATVLMFAAWMDEWYGFDKLWPTIFFLTLFFVIFALLAVLYNVVNKRPTQWPDLALVFINAMLYFGTCYELLDKDHQSVLGVFAVLVSGFYLALGYFTNRRDREDTLLVYTFVGLAVLFAVLAVPIQFDQHWVTIAWALEGAVLTLIGLKANDRISRYGALVVFVIAATHWVGVDVHDFAYGVTSDFVPLLNRRALSGGMLVIALAAAAFFYKRYGEEVEESERGNLAALYVLGANVLALALLSIDANDYFEQARSRQPGDARVNETLGRLIDGHRLTLTALWAMYGAAMLIAGIARRLKPLRVFGLLLLGVATIKVVVLDARHYDASWHFVIFNQTFAAFALVIVALGAGAWFYWKDESIDEGERTLVATALAVIANVLAVVALSAEAVGHFDRALAEVRIPGALRGRLSEIENTKQLVLSVLWSIYGAVALIIGIRRGAKPIRWGALILLTIAEVKVLFIDLGYFDAEWHRLIFNQTFATFAVLVAALACGIAYYSRSDKVPEPERTTAVQALIVVVNLFAIIGLSAEAIGYFDRALAEARGLGVLPGALAEIENTKQLVLSVLWSIYGAVALIIGIKRGAKPIRWGALILLTIVAVKVLFIDLGYYDAEWHRLVFNQTFAAFAILVAALACGLAFYARSDKVAEPERTTAVNALMVVANLFAIIGLSAEAIGHYGQLIQAGGLASDKMIDLHLAQRLSLSVVWMVYGGAMLAIGIWRRNKLLRVMALALLSITILKVFFFDLSSLEKLYRIISFIVLGVILLAVSFLYQRLRQRTEAFSEVDAPTPVSAESE